MITVRQAERLLQQHRPPIRSVRVALDAAAGLVLAESVKTDRPFPPYDRVMMDGIALAFNAWQRGRRDFVVEAVQRPGERRRQRKQPNGCLEVMTGAVLPAGCDCVVPVEEVAFRDRQASIVAGAVLQRRQFVHRAGSDAPKGKILLQPGQVLAGPAIAAIASVGKRSVAVHRPLQVQIISTGDELVSPDSKRRARPHEIYRSNPHALAASLRLHGSGPVQCAHAADDRAELRHVLRQALNTAEVIVVTGGVSKGRYDYVPDVLRDLGVAQVFHRVRQRPGRPMWFGTGRRKQLVFGLPGNPVSCLVGLHRYVLPILSPAYAPRRVPLAARIARQAVTLFPSVRIGPRGANAVALKTSGDVARLAGSDGFVEIPAGTGYVPSGAPVPFYPWH